MTIEAQMILALAVVLIGLVGILLVILSAIWEHVQLIETHLRALLAILTAMSATHPQEDEHHG